VRAALCNGFHGIKALSIGETPGPRTGADEVLIGVHAACVSFADYLMICGIRSGQLSLTFREWTPRGLSWPAAKKRSAVSSRRSGRLRGLVRQPCGAHDRQGQRECQAFRKMQISLLGQPYSTAMSPPGMH
jgi:hypothetical protein